MFQWHIDYCYYQLRHYNRATGCLVALLHAPPDSPICFDFAVRQTPRPLGPSVSGQCLG